MWESSSVSPSSSFDNNVRRMELYREVVCVRRLLRYEDIVSPFWTNLSRNSMLKVCDACRNCGLWLCDVGPSFYATPSPHNTPCQYSPTTRTRWSKCVGSRAH